MLQVIQQKKVWKRKRDIDKEESAKVPQKTFK